MCRREAERLHWSWLRTCELCRQVRQRVTVPILQLTYLSYGLIPQCPPTKCRDVWQLKPPSRGIPLFLIWPVTSTVRSTHSWHPLPPGFSPRPWLPELRDQVSQSQTFNRHRSPHIKKQMTAHRHGETCNTHTHNTHINTH